MPPDQTATCSAVKGDSPPDPSENRGCRSSDQTRAPEFLDFGVPAGRPEMRECGPEPRILVPPPSLMRWRDDIACIAGVNTWDTEMRSKGPRWRTPMTSADWPPAAVRRSNDCAMYTGATVQLNRKLQGCEVCVRSYGVTVGTLDSESTNRGVNSRCNSCAHKARVKNRERNYSFHRYIR